MIPKAVRTRQTLLTILFVSAGFFPFLNKAFHIDDTNFIGISKQIRRAPLDPYSFSINWLGNSERAYDILANPPLVPYYIALVSSLFGEREWILRLSFFPFFIVVVIAFFSLTKRFASSSVREVPLLIFISSSSFLISSHFIMPDLPLLAFYLSGLCLYIRGVDGGRRFHLLSGAIILGLTPLCRYSGITAPILASIYTFMAGERGRKGIPFLFVSLGILVLYCLWSSLLYGSIHPLHMTSFESGSTTISSFVEKGMANLSYIGGTILFPLLFLLIPSILRGVGSMLALLIGLSLGLFAGIWYGYPIHALILCSIFFMSALLIIFRCFVKGGGSGGKSRDRTFLILWFILPFLFNLFLLFASVRYILPMVPPILLLFVNSTHGYIERRRFVIVALLNLLFSLFLAYSDMRYAGVYRDFVRNLNSLDYVKGKEILFAGHWGFQYYMEREGAKPLEEDRPDISSGDIIVFARYPWPQHPGSEVRNRLRPHTKYEYPSKLPLRTTSDHGFASFFSHRLSTKSVPVFLPYGIGFDEYEVFEVYRVK